MSAYSFVVSEGWEVSNEENNIANLSNVSLNVNNQKIYIENPVKLVAKSEKTPLLLKLNLNQPINITK